MTGVALKKFNGVFHFLVTERELLGYGTVNTSVPVWRSYNSDDYFSAHDTRMHEGIDYHAMSHQNRTLNLDLVAVPQGRLVTGIRFTVVDGVITIQVRGTKFDFTTGKLQDIDQSFWYVSAPRNRTEINLANSRASTQCPEKSIIDITQNRFVKFGPTSREADAAQTTSKSLGKSFTKFVV